jgi:hypothetical protein
MVGGADGGKQEGPKKVPRSAHYLCEVFDNVVSIDGAVSRSPTGRLGRVGLMH